MNVVCPCCATKFPLEAGLTEGDAKRLGVLLGDMEPPIARACMGYLRLFKPKSQELRVARAIAILNDVATLVNAGSVSRDERTGLYRPTVPAMWAQGMEQMQITKLELPLKSHGYLRAVVFAIADTADGKAELQREKDRRQGRSATVARDPRAESIATYNNWLSRGLITPEQHAEKMSELDATSNGGQA